MPVQRQRTLLAITFKCAVHSTPETCIKMLDSILKYIELSQINKSLWSNQHFSSFFVKKNIKFYQVFLFEIIFSAIESLFLSLFWITVVFKTEISEHVKHIDSSNQKKILIPLIMYLYRWITCVNDQRPLIVLTRVSSKVRQTHPKQVTFREFISVLVIGIQIETLCVIDMFGDHSKAATIDWVNIERCRLPTRGTSCT